MTDSAQQALEQGSYELIKRRLSNFGADLKQHIDALNQERADTFGCTELQVKGRVRVRTEYNSIPRDIVIIGDKVIFAYNVFLGIKKNTHVDSVFSVHKLVYQDDHYEVEPYPTQTKFLTDNRFLRDFEELYTYYKETRLQHLFHQNGKLFACFQIGDKLTDVRVFRWQIESDNTLNYIDNRGERELNLSEDYDFEWQSTGREHHVEGRFGHINVLDKVFVDCLNGQLTIKQHNNTDSQEGVYCESVEDKNQSLADCQLEYAELGGLILLKVLPYREKQWRYFVYNTRNHQVLRQDALGDACVQLPDDHGVIFPGGYYLQSGQTRYFDEKIENLEFHKQIKSPNGEDVLYVFYEPNEGRYALFAYNLIDKNLQNPIYCHGYGLFEDGLTLTFKADSDEAERVHPIQIWQSPFFSAEFAANAPAPTSLLGKIGNPDLVRCISDLYSVCKAINEQQASLNHYEDLIAGSRAIFDRYHWLNDDKFASINDTLHQVFEAAEQVLDEFEKVSEIQNRAKTALGEFEKNLREQVRQIRPDSFKLASEFVAAIDSLKQLTGRLISLEDVKFIDAERLSELRQEIDQHASDLNTATARFLQDEKALAPYKESLREFEQQTEKSNAVAELNQILDGLNKQSQELDLLNHTMLDLDIEDSRVRTQILEDISAIYGLVNRAKANAENKKKSVGSVEASAEFAARFKLFSQSITNALNNAKTPEQCDEQFSRLLIQLEELESQFSEFDEFLSEIVAKRDDVYESFESHKQQLIDAQQRRALTLGDAAERIISSVVRRSQKFTDIDKLNSYFASDAMIAKLRTLVEELRSLGDDIRADDVLAKLKSAKDQGVRTLRDKQDIYSDGGNSVSIGKHQFSVNNQLLDLTLLPRDDQLLLHLTGTDYFEAIPCQQTQHKLASVRHLWQQNLVSETDTIYRAEFLAASILYSAQSGDSDFSLHDLYVAQENNTLEKLVQDYAEPRYQEGYEKGIHDHDAYLILSSLLTQKKQLGLLTYASNVRLMGLAFCVELEQGPRAVLRQQAHNAVLMNTQFDDSRFLAMLVSDVKTRYQQFKASILSFAAMLGDCNDQLVASYVIHQLAAQTTEQSSFVLQNNAKTLAEQFIATSKSKGIFQQIETTLSNLSTLDERAVLACNWLHAYCKGNEIEPEYANEAALYVLMDHLKQAKFETKRITINSEVGPLIGQHTQIKEQHLRLDYAEFSSRLNTYLASQVDEFKMYHQMRNEVLKQQNERLQLDEFRAKPLSSFVRNQLIDKVYFPIIGDNLAKQIGAAGKAKRSDLMGMLLLISPPGYGKTTLIEYVANRLGLTFVKVNCPSIGHEQVSLDASQAMNATAAKEIEKINQSFEMGNNVMLYLDDIQHTNPEFLQKFISLCDGSRRIDGVWNGKSKTYDLRGKKFAVVMAGNPYTESGESFQIPDMLANRADIYNLGDTLAGCEHEFAMSFIENSLTSNKVLAPLANRNMQDLYKLLRISQGEDISINELEYQYSQAEANEIVQVLTKLCKIRETILVVNQQYIASAAQDDQYRTEPAFKLQGSYRNMNKMAEKVVAAMNDEELENLISDHYRGEAQTLSKGSEENLLKLAELRGTLDAQQSERWQQIKEDYQRMNRLSEAGSPAMMAVQELAHLHDALNSIGDKLTSNNLTRDYSTQISSLIDKLASQLSALNNNDTLANIDQTLQNTLAQTPYLEVLQQHTEQKSQSNTLSQQLITAINGLPAEISRKSQLDDLINVIANTQSKDDIVQSIEQLGQQLESGERYHAITDAYKQRSELAEQSQQQIVSQLQQMTSKINELCDALAQQQQHSEAGQGKLLEALTETSQQVKQTVHVEPDPQVGYAVQAIADTLDNSLIPVLKIMQHKIRLDHDVWKKVDAVSTQLKQLDSNYQEPESPMTCEDKEIVQ